MSARAKPKGSRVERVRISTLLVDRNLLADEKEAAAYVLAGKVLAGGQRVDKPGDLVPRDADLRVRGLDNPYVSRGGLKLAGALADFGLDVTGRVAVDCGACTGGFTDCLLQHGAARVYSVEVGHGQLDWRLQTDPRVVNMERTNISDVAAGSLSPPPTLAVADLSYLSLRTAMPVAAALLEGPSGPDPEAGQLVLLVKPLFEGAANAGLLGMEMYERILRGLVVAVRDSGLVPLGVTLSPIRGSSGTVEFFLHVSRPPHDPAPDGAIEAQVQRSLALISPSAASVRG